ncbi:hypothetical protein AMECASPLE_005128 [Ameca splendens]|uniref:Uncharacterized protein n=1 Tax=Ameca splendens TaxID=208324 RepID=A0ABV0Z8A7_9TELE
MQATVEAEILRPRFFFRSLSAFRPASCDKQAESSSPAVTATPTPPPTCCSRHLTDSQKELWNNKHLLLSRRNIIQNIAGILERMLTHSPPRSYLQP